MSRTAPTDPFSHAQRVTLAAAVAATVLLFWTPLLDRFGLPKLAALLIAAAVVLALRLAAASVQGRLEVPRIVPVYAAGAVVLFACVSLVASDAPLLSLVGVYGIYAGVATYVACAVLFLGVLGSHTSSTLPRLAWVCVAVLGIVAVYGLLQANGVDLVSVPEEAIAPLGNSNFAAAVAAITIPLAAMLALRRGTRPAHRGTAAAIAVTGLAFGVSTETMQGPVASTVGLVVVAAVWFRTSTRRARRPGTAVAAGLVAAGVAAIGSAAAGIRWIPGLIAAPEVTLRVDFWTTGARMARENPLLGVGMDRYEAWYRAFRPTHAVLREDLPLQASNPHDVPLSMLTGGGVLLAVAYLVFIGAVAWLLVRGLLRLEGDRLLLLGGFGGAWAAYQAQSFVSIDVVPLAVLHWVLAGAVVVLAAGPVHQMAATGVGWPRLVSGSPRRQRSVAAWIAAATAAVGLIALSWPLRADAAVADGRRLAEAGDAEGASAAFEKATGLAGWQPRYWFHAGRGAQDVGDIERALSAYEVAAERDPRLFGAALEAGRSARELGAEDVARRWYERALDLDPQHPALKAEAASLAGASGRYDRAQELLSAALELRPDEADWWRLLGQARQLDGDLGGARQAYERALEIDPDDDQTRRLLDELRS